MNAEYEAESREVINQTSPGPRPVVIGSTSFLGPDSARICDAVAADLAMLADLVAVTGGMTGVGQTFGLGFAAARRAREMDEKLYHLLHKGFGPIDSGITLDAGTGFHERRVILGTIGQAYLMIEGGPGTRHEAEVAASKGFPVIPLARTGGHAGVIYRPDTIPAGVPPDLWRTLDDRNAPIESVIQAVRGIVSTILKL